VRRNNGEARTAFSGTLPAFPETNSSEISAFLSHKELSCCSHTDWKNDVDDFANKISIAAGAYPQLCFMCTAISFAIQHLIKLTPLFGIPVPVLGKKSRI